ncbi:MAG: MFS transporter, partial [Phycisphaerae bacterium]|nr:MFS transporter [Phycisphaerae bacterium]
DGKMRGLFTLLFGAGMVLFLRGAEAREAGSGPGLLARRLGWLALFGLLHWALLWRGDILLPYAVAGLLMLGFAGYGIGVWTPSFLVRSHGMSLKDAGAVMGVLGGLAAVLGTLTSGWLCDRLAARDPRWRIGVPILGCAIALPAGLLFYALPAGGAWSLVGLQVPKPIVAYLVFGVT